MQLFAAVFFFLFVIILFNNACRKDDSRNEDNKNFSLTSAIEQLSQNDRITQQEISSYIHKLPAFAKASLILDKAQYNVIDKHQVIRIPIAEDAAFYLTKENGTLLGYLYKWEKDKLNDSPYTGNLFSYSIENNQAWQLSYKNGIIIKNGSAPKESTKLPTSITPTKKASETADIGEFLEKIWCWLTGGSWSPGNWQIYGFCFYPQTAGYNPQNDESGGNSLGGIPAGVQVWTEVPLTELVLVLVLEVVVQQLCLRTVVALFG